MSRLGLSRLVFASLLHSNYAFNLLSSPTELPTKEYDFIVAGGGTAGCVLASRLTENHNVSVLMVEAGGNNKDFFDSTVPYLASALQHGPADWNLTTTPQPGYGNRSINFERGHILGGSSSVNYMAYNRGSNDVWDRWANITEDQGWSWSEVEKYYLKTSRLVAPADGHNYTDETIASAHGYGPVEVSVAGDLYEIDHLVINASKQIGGRFRFNQDYNDGDSVGFSWSQSSIGNGRRSSAATAYLDPLYNSNRNLDVLINTQVTSLEQTSNVNGIPQFKVACIAQSALATPIHVRARNEIILSTGVVGTPKLLMLSGIGPSSFLRDLDIPTIVDLPSVGKNLTDHPLNTMYFSVQRETISDPIIRNQTLFAEALAEWNKTGQGPMSDSTGNTMAFQKLPSNASIWESVKVDPTAGSLSGNTELIIADGFVPLGNIPPPSTGNYITVIGVVVSPTSRGTIAINTTDAFASPVIDPQYLTTPFDAFASVQNMHDTFTLLSSPTFSGYIGQPYGELANLTASNDESLLAYARAHSVTINHGIGTAKMSAKGAAWGVVDPDLTVKGVNGLRIVDASVFPEIPECHVQAPVYILAERAADLIKKSYAM